MRKPISAALMTAAALVLAQPAFAQTMVSEVDVEVDLASIENEQAAAFWTDVADDLENAIVARLTDRIADDGVKITVDVSEVELANSFESALGLAESRLAGSVRVTSDTDNSDFENYDLLATFDQTYLPPDVDLSTVTTDSPVYYATMVEIFADRIVEKLDE